MAKYEVVTRHTETLLYEVEAGSDEEAQTLVLEGMVKPLKVHQDGDDVVMIVRTNDPAARVLDARRKRTPKAFALEGQVREALKVVLSKDYRRRLEDSTLPLGYALQNGEDVSEEFAVECERLIERALATVEATA